MGENLILPLPPILIPKRQGRPGDARGRPDTAPVGVVAPYVRENGASLQYEGGIMRRLERQRKAIVDAWVLGLTWRAKFMRN